MKLTQQSSHNHPETSQTINQLSIKYKISTKKGNQRKLYGKLKPSTLRFLYIRSRHGNTIIISPFPSINRPIQALPPDDQQNKEPKEADTRH